MFGGIAAAGSDRIVFATSTGAVLLFDLETGRLDGHFSLHPCAPDTVHVSCCAVDRDKTVLLADARHRRVRRFTLAGRPVARYGRTPTPGPTGPQDEPGILDEPCALLPLEDGLLVACGGPEAEHGVQRLDAGGAHRMSLSSPGGPWRRAQGLARVGEEIWVCETEAGLVRRYRLDGRHLDRIELPEGLGLPLRIAYDGYEGALLTLAPETEDEQGVLGAARLDLDGNFEGWAVEAGEDPGRVYCPFDIAVLRDGRFVVADLPLGAPPDVRLQLFTADGRWLKTLVEDSVDLVAVQRAWFEQVLRAGPDYERARVHHYHGGGTPDHHEEARRLYLAALQGNGDRLLAHFGLGVLCQRALDDPEAAEEHYEAAIAAGGDEGDLRALVAECRRARGDLDGAIAVLEAAVEGDHPPEEIHRRLEDLGTWYLERAGEAPDAML